MNDNNLNKPSTEADMYNNDHDLEDIIIIDKEAVNSNKINSLLTIVALIIVLFIIIIVFVSDDENKKNKLSILEKNNSEIIAPELVLQSKPVETKKDEVKKQTEEDSKITDIIKNRFTDKEPEKDSKDVGNVEVVSEVSSNKNIEKNISDTIMPTTVKPIINIEKEVTNQVANDMLEKIKADEKIEKELKESSKKAEVKSKPIQVVKPEAKKETKPEVKTKTIEKKRTYKPKKTPVKRKSTKSVSFYIQVGAYRNTPSKRFISVIKNNGFKYKITNITANGTKKLLIGPYSNRGSVDRALIQVRDRITKSAFVVKQ